MNKTLTKLIMAALALVLAVSVAVMATYAWTILSKNPGAEGIQINIGGGNTILIAPDITQTVDGSVYHYPGTFSEKLNFSSPMYLRKVLFANFGKTPREIRKEKQELI